MLTEVQAGPYTVRGISVGGVYTSMQVPELDVLLDCGLPIRSFAGTDRIFLSHGHPDHASGLISLMGIRTLIGKTRGPKVFAPKEIVPLIEEGMAVMTRLHRTELRPELVPMSPGDSVALGHDLWVRAFRTHHGVPSLGYQFLRKVVKLKPEFRSLPGPEIGRLRASGEPGVFDELERVELSYATDTTSRVLESSPSLLTSRVLILECTFIDPERTVQDARERMHIHLDELLANPQRFENEHLVLMHFSQAYAPAQVHALVRSRLPVELAERVRIFAPESGRWFG